jgi:lipid A ethanolaminephosphotransferase
MSEGYRKRFALSNACVSEIRDRRFSHDNLYHTVLGMLGVKTARYDRAMDMLAQCRSAAD